MKRLTHYCMILLVIAAGGLSAANAAVPQVAGTWLITGTVEDTTPGCPPEGFTFANLASVARDGTVVNVDPAGGTQVGEASRLPGDRYAISFFGFLGPNLLEVSGIGELDNPNELAGTFNSTLTLQGTEVCAYSGSLTGSRLVPSAM